MGSGASPGKFLRPRPLQYGKHPLIKINSLPINNLQLKRGIVIEINCIRMLEADVKSHAYVSLYNLVTLYYFPKISKFFQAIRAIF